MSSRLDFLIEQFVFGKEDMPDVPSLTGSMEGRVDVETVGIMMQRELDSRSENIQQGTTVEADNPAREAHWLGDDNVELES